MKKLQPTEYMYASARMRAMENRLIGRERMELLVEARSADEVMDRLTEFGLSPAETEGTTALPAGEGAFEKVFITEVLTDVSAVYKATNGSGYVFVSGETFVGTDAQGTVV